MKTKPNFFYDKMFMANFWLFWKWSVKDYQEYLKEEFGVVKDLTEYYGSFEVFEKENKRIHLIWVSDDSRSPYADLAHECVHAANFVLNQAGVLPDFNNDEAHAYYVRMLMNEVLDGKEIKQTKNKKKKTTKQHENKKQRKV